MRDLPRLRVYRLILYLAVSALVAGTAGVTPQHRAITVSLYLALGLSASALPFEARSATRPGGGRLWILTLGLDLLAHSLVVVQMGGPASTFLLLLALPILLWGILRGLPGGLWASGGAVLVEGVMLAGRLVGGRISSGAEPPAFDHQMFLFHSLSFLLLGAFAALLGRRIQQEEALHLRTRSELEQAELDAESIMSCLSTGLLCLDWEGQIRWINRKAQSWLDPWKQDEARQSLSSWSGEPALAPLANALQGHLASGRESTIEITLERSDGALPLEISSTPILGHGGEIRGLVALVSDLRERRAREDEQTRREKLAWIGELSAGLAHEIRNSLKPITGSLELLRSDLPRTGPARESLMEIIFREAENLESFLSEFLSLARDKSLQVETLPLERVVEEELESVRAVTPRPILFRRPEGEDGTLWIQADRGALGQVLRNLALNAVEAGGEGTVELSYERDGGEAALFLRDHGPGIPEEIRERVFDPFFTTKPHGTGLGLAIARDLMNRQGGGLTLHPAPGGGTIACLRLLLAKAVGGPAELPVVSGLPPSELTRAA